MLHFIYTFSEHKSKRESAFTKTVRLYRIKKNIPIFVGELSDSFVSEFQLVMMTAEKYKALPKSVFTENKATGGYKYSSAYSIENAGIATFNKV